MSRAFWPVALWTLITSVIEPGGAEVTTMFKASYTGISWDAASKICDNEGSRLCRKKDLCQQNSVIRSGIQSPVKDTWIPIGDQYNEWMYLGPRVERRCTKLTDVEGPPFWQPRECQLRYNKENQPRKKQQFCNKSKGYFCCDNSVEVGNASPRPKPVYIFSRTFNEIAYYRFSLHKHIKENSWETDQAPWRKGGRLNGDLSMITLMSGYVKGRFPDPVYFCYRNFTESGGLITTLHKVSKSWCDGIWSFNFYVYGRFSIENSADFQRLVVGNFDKSNSHDRIALTENAMFPTAFVMHGLRDSENPRMFTHTERITQSSCGSIPETLTSKSGIISTPNFPSKYGLRTIGNVRCEWKIIGPVGSVVKIVLKSIDLSGPRRSPNSLQFRPFQGRHTSGFNFNAACRYDQLEIHGYGNFCGKTRPPAFYTVTNEINLTFFGRWGSTGRGFALFYEIIEPRYQLREIRPNQASDSFSWTSANATCFQNGKGLCRANEICLSNSRPFYGAKQGDQWAPIGDQFNDWIQIGRGNVEICRRHNAVLGPPEWGIDVESCPAVDFTRPCPLRKFAYCCDYSTAMPDKLGDDGMVTINVLKTERSGVPFYKFIRKFIDNSQSFDSARIWRMDGAVKQGEITAFSFRSQRSEKFNKVLFFCSMTVIPSIGGIRMAFAISLEPCQEKGWKYLFHLYAMSEPAVASVKLYVGVRNVRPFHTMVHRNGFTPGFRNDRGFIVYAARAFMQSRPDQDIRSMKREEACSESTVTIEAPATLQSPGYPKSYGPNALCRWLVTMPQEAKRNGGRLKLTIEELSLEDPVDVLNIKEIDSKSGANDTKGRDFSGTVSHLSMITDQSFLLQFTSDSSVSGKGFRIGAEVLNVLCGGVVEQDGYVISYSDTPEKERCVWTIRSPPGYSIEVEFVSFDLIRDVDCTKRVEISYGEERKMFCGGKLPPKRVITHSGIVKVTFLSTSTLPSKGKGFTSKIRFRRRQQPAIPTSKIQCGIQSVPFPTGAAVSEKIVNGNVAAKGNFPWLVMIAKPQVTCGGTLINERFVLTATHCFISQYDSGLGMMSLRTPLNRYTIIAGRYRSNAPSPGEQKFNVSAIHVHGGFQRFAARWVNQIGSPFFAVFPYNDITLAKLSRDAIFSHSVSPACLPTQDAQAGDFCYVAGWGSLSPKNVAIATVLNYAKVPILDSTICGKWEEMKGTVMENVLCAGFVNGGGDFCWGDSGGSLVCRGKYGNFYINGIVSWSRECAGTRTPGMYTRVWNFVDWIRNEIS